MSKIINTYNSFRNGITSDKYKRGSLTFMNHFDPRYGNLLVPQESTEAAGDSYLDTYDIFRWNEFDGNFYGLGLDPGTSQAQIYYLDTTGTPVWSDVPTGKSATENTAIDDSPFFYYKQGFYGIQRGAATSANSYLWQYLSSTWTESYQTLSTETNVHVEPVHHHADDNAYFFGKNFVYRLDNTTWDGTVLTLPDNMEIVSACEYGNYLAIAANPTIPAGTTTRLGGDSYVYIWDRDSSLNTITAKINFGKANIKHISALGENLIAVAKDTTYGLNDRFLVLGANLGSKTAVVMNELYTNIVTGASAASTINFTGNKIVDEDIMYFPCAISFNDGSTSTVVDARTVKAIYAVNAQGNVWLDYTQEGVTADEYINGIYKYDNKWHIAHSNDGSYSLTDDNTYTNDSYIETAYLDKGKDDTVMAKLLGITVTTTPLDSGDTITIKYKTDQMVDDLDDWITIQTFTTVDTKRHTAVRLSDGVFPTVQDMQLRIESTGGATVTGIKAVLETVDNDLYK